MSSKKKILVAISLITILVLTGCFGDKTAGPVQEICDLNVIVRDASGSSLNADLIVLLDSSERIVNTAKNLSTYQFDELDNGKYTLVVGKEDYRAKIENISLTKDTTKSVTMIQGEDYSPITVNVVNSDNQPVDNAIITATRNGQVVDKGITVNGSDTLNYIWRGLDYEYKIIKDGYTSDLGAFFNRFDQGEITFSIDKRESTTSIGEVNKYIFSEGENKYIEIGNLASDQEVIIGITPLNLDSAKNETYAGEIKVELVNKNIQTNLTKLPLDEDNRIKSLNLNSNVSINRPITNDVDSYFYQKSKDLFDEYGSQRSQLSHQLKSKVQIQSSGIGDIRNFKVADFSTSPAVSYRNVTTKLYDNTEAYIYVTEETSVPSTFLTKMINSLTGIIDTNMNYFSSHKYEDYDADSNGKLTIVLASFGNMGGEGVVMGYFNPIDYFPADYSYQTSNSNEGDIIYLNSDVVSNYPDEIISTIAHELQHLIFFNEKMFAGRYDAEDIWINEGFSGLAEYLNGYYDYISDGRIYHKEYKNGYFNKPNQESALLWNNNLSDYGASNLLTLYLYEKYKDNNFIKKVNTSKYEAHEIITTDFNDNFTSIFLDWLATNYAEPNNLNINNLSYSSIDLTASPEIENLSSYDEFNIKSTAVKYYRIHGSDQEVNINISLSEETGVFILKN